MSIDTKALDNAADTFSRSMRALNSMEIADLPPELDQDARDIARIIQDHGKGYEGTEYDDMTAPLLESLARLVSAAASAQRLQAEVEQLAASEKTCRRIANEKTLEVMELRQQLAAAQAERKRNGWCIWSPWSGYLSSTFAGTRTECIKVFERDANSPWRRYREQGFECRPVLFVDARKESGVA